MENWRSPLLGVRFSTSEGDLVLFHPDGERFIEFVEAIEQRDRALAEKERERLEKEQTQAALEEERKRNQQLRDRLIQLGIDPENLS